MHAGGVGAMEAAHPPWDGDHRHGWATGAQHGAQESRIQVGSSVRAATGEALSFIWFKSSDWLLEEEPGRERRLLLLVVVSVCCDFQQMQQGYATLRRLPPQQKTTTAA